MAFSGCSSLTSIEIPNSVAEIVNYTFENCSSLTSVVIPNSVTYIGASAFAGCSSLTTIFISGFASYISEKAFASCKNLTDVFCYAVAPPNASANTFKDSYTEYATLHVPAEAIEKYMTKEPWSGFGSYKTIEGDEMRVCAKPTVAYADGKLQFACETEEADIYYTLIAPDVKTTNTHVNDGNILNLNAYYDIKFYAVASGYSQSETVKAKLYWLASSGAIDDGTSVSTVKMRGITIQSDGDFVTITGLDNNERVCYFSIDGKKLGEIISTNGIANFAVTRSSVVIARIGNESVKIAVE